MTLSNRRYSQNVLISKSTTSSAIWTSSIERYLLRDNFILISNRWAAAFQELQPLNTSQIAIRRRIMQSQFMVRRYAVQNEVSIWNDFLVYDNRGDDLKKGWIMVFSSESRYEWLWIIYFLTSRRACTLFKKGNSIIAPTIVTHLECFNSFLQPIAALFPIQPNL